MAENSGKVEGRKIVELTDVYDERVGQGRRSGDGKNPQQIIVIDGRGYERVKSNGHSMHDLTDVVDDHLVSPQMKEAIMKQAVEIIEKMAREMIPEIAQRVIREEIEKIKTAGAHHKTRQD
ncbi:MAG: hypothetical protein PHG54_07990 [Smithellaceae bacterium]|nr:hypothetical protein [Syntrophaceae bacterium]MDD4241360.1 hypothetical protein [Smithellaceae bacterium]NLX52403.1 hypothetical protein [Deltaproteobacteria bacterium]